MTGDQLPVSQRRSSVDLSLSKCRTWRRMYRKFGDSPQVSMVSIVAAKFVSSLDLTSPAVNQRDGKVAIVGGEYR